MKVQEKTDLQLGANWYTVDKWVGRGTVNYVYRAFPRDIDAEIPVAIKVLKEPKTRVVVAIDRDQGMPVGVMVRAHRRY